MNYVTRPADDTELNIVRPYKIPMNSAENIEESRGPEFFKHYADGLGTELFVTEIFATYQTYLDVMVGTEGRGRHDGKGEVRLFPAINIEYFFDKPDIQTHLITGIMFDDFSLYRKTRMSCLDMYVKDISGSGKADLATLDIWTGSQLALYKGPEYVRRIADSYADGGGSIMHEGPVGPEEIGYIFTHDRNGHIFECVPINGESASLSVLMKALDELTGISKKAILEAASMSRLPEGLENLQKHAHTAVAAAYDMLLHPELALPSGLRLTSGLEDP